MLAGAVLVLLLLRMLSHGEAVELDDLLGLPQMVALTLVAILLLILWLTAGPGRTPALGMLAIAAAGLMTILFPERMPDTTRGGTLMTAFWSVFGWLLIALAYAVVFFA